MNEIIVTEEHSRAVSLHRKIKANVQCAKETFLELGRSLKEMRDGKLYKELGYQNFEEYCEAETEIGRRHSYRMIQIVENLPDDFVTSMSQIGTTKLSLLAMLDPADREEIQQSVNVEETSVRELKARIKELEARNQETEEELEESKEKAERSVTDAAAAKARAVRLEAQISDLEAQVKQLESRPVEVAVSTEAEEKVQELQIKLATLRRDHEKQLAEIEQAEAERGRKAQQDAIDREREHQQEINSIRAEYEQKLSANTETVVDTKAVFKVHYANAIASVDKMFDFINAASDDDKAFFIAKAQALSARIASMADASEELSNDPA